MYNKTNKYVLILMLIMAKWFLQFFSHEKCFKDFCY